MARTIAISNQKGGVAKSTTVVNLGAALARLGVRVLLVDVDMEGQLDLWMNVQPTATLYDVIVGSVATRSAVVALRDRLDLLASGGQELARHIFQLRDARQVPRLLTTVLAPLQRSYDVILLDCAPGLDPLAIAAYAAADEVLIPTTTQRAGIDGMVKQINTLDELQEAGYRMQISGIIPTLYDPQVKEHRFWLEQIERQFPGAVTPPIRHDVRLQELPRLGRTIFEHAPSSRGAADYLALARRVADGS
ncbi:MAG TPA: ParA family protein [Herpetosiphonaceae bacterium]